jgi:hypothetical protein
MSLISGITNPKCHKWTKETPNGPDYTQRSLNPKHPNKSNSDKDHKDHVNTPPLVLSNGPDYSQKTKASSQLSMSRSAYQSSLIENDGIQPKTGPECRFTDRFAPKIDG